MRAIGIVAVCHDPAFRCFYQIASKAKNAGVKQPRLFLESSGVADYVAALNAFEQGNMHDLVNLILSGINALNLAGAQIIIIPNNAVHCIFDQLVCQSPVPLINIADATAKKCLELNCQSVCVLGTKLVFQSGLYRQKLAHLGIDVTEPDGDDQNALHQILMNATQGEKISNDAMNNIRTIIDRLKERKGFDAVILACSELKLFDFENHFVCVDPFEQLANKAWEMAQCDN